MLRSKRPSIPPAGSVEVLPARDGRLPVRLSGVWSIHSGWPDARAIRDGLREAGRGATLVFEAEGLEKYDSSLPAFLLRCEALAKSSGATLDPEGLPDGVRRLYALATARAVKSDASHEEEVGTFLHRVGEWGLKASVSWRRALDFIGQTALAFGALLRGKARMNRGDLMYFIQACGVDALPIVTLISFLTGLIMAYVGSVQLNQFGATMYVANLVGLAMVREMGVLMTSIILCGRTGAAFAAQLGSMNASEEVAAFRVLGINPVEYLVLPRMLALMIMLPVLVLYSNFIGIIGGLVVVTSMDVSMEQYFSQLVKAVNLANFFSGLIKSVFFGVLIAWAGCFRGMIAGRSSLAVGDAATGAAVLGITLIIIADALFAVLFNVIGYF